MSDTIHYTVGFADFQFLQGHMTRRVYARNKGSQGAALFSVVLCALFLTTAIVINLQPYPVSRLFGISYPLSVYLVLIICLVGAILALIPAIRLRMKTLRMQVSDDGPLLGPTKLTVEEDGLTVERPMVRSKYRWAAFQGVEMVKNALILPVDNGIGLIIPASAFPGEAERFAFAAQLSRKIQEEKASSSEAPAG